MPGVVYEEGVVPSGINRIAITGCVILAVIMPVSYTHLTLPTILRV